MAFAENWEELHQMRELKVKVGGDTSGWELAAARVRGEARQMASALASNIGGRMAGLFTVGAIEQTIRKTAEYAGQLTDMSARTGVAVETLQRLDRAARENGTSLDALVGLWERVGSAREDALKDKKGSAAKAFGALGVSQGTLSSGSPDEIVRKIAEAFQNSANVEQLISPLRDIGGRGAGQMIALFRAGLDQQYQDMQVMTGAQADLLDELDDRWSTLGQRISVGVTPAVIWLIKVFGWLQDQFEQTVEGFASMFRYLKSIVGNGKNDPIGDAKGAWDAFTKGVHEASSEIDDRNEAEDVARAERVKNRLNFGKFDARGVETQKAVADKFTMAEMKLDDLSKAGLFAGGAGSGMMDNMPQKQLAAMDKIVSGVAKTNQILEDSL